MKPVDTLNLNSWVINNRKHLMSADRGTIKQLASKASLDLGIKVPSGALADLMRANGIETRRLSRQETKELAMRGEIEKLTAENLELRRTLGKVEASDYIAADLKEFIFAGLKEEIREAIFAPVAV